MLIVVFFFFLEHTRLFRAYASIAWVVSVNHKHAVACCIVVWESRERRVLQRWMFFVVAFLLLFFVVTFLVITFFVSSWLLALYKLPANISFWSFISSDKHLSDMFCLSEMSCLLDKFCFYMLFLSFRISSLSFVYIFFFLLQILFLFLSDFKCKFNIFRYIKASFFWKNVGLILCKRLQGFHVAVTGV